MNAIDEPRMLAISVQRLRFDIDAILKTPPGGAPAAAVTIAGGGRAPHRSRRLSRDRRGRSLFALVGEGGLGLGIGRDLAGCTGVGSVPPVEGLADLHRRGDDARLRAGDVALEDRRHGRPSAGTQLPRAARTATGVPGLRLPLR